MKILKTIFLFFIVYSANCYNIIFNIGSTGLLLPYTMGSLGYIKKNVKIDNYELIGTSGGAWCATLYLFENDLSNHDKIWNIFLKNETNEINAFKNLDIFANLSRQNFKDRYKSQNYKIQNININVLDVTNIFKIKNIKISQFNDIDDLINLCYASSYIPFISGKNICYKYNYRKFIDGAVLNNDNKCYNIKYDTNLKNNIINNYIKLNINYKMWGRKFNEIDKRNILNIKSSNYLYKIGWEDTEKNIHKYLKKYDEIIK